MNHDAACGDGQRHSRDEEAAFARLEELLELLPVMQEKGEVLACARHAQVVARAVEAHDACRSMLETAQEQLSAAEATLAAARAGDDSVEVDVGHRAVLLASSQRGFRVGPARNAARALDDALAVSPFFSVQDALVACLDEDEMQRIEAEIDAYQKEYAETLARCERFAGPSSSGR